MLEHIGGYIFAELNVLNAQLFVQIIVQIVDFLFCLLDRRQVKKVPSHSVEKCGGTPKGSPIFFLMTLLHRAESA